MNDKQDRPYVCGAPGCSQRFQLEEHLIIHRHKHEMTLKFPSIKTDVAFTDQTPTPTRFLQNCEEVGLFKEIEEEFLQAQEEENKKQVSLTLVFFGPFFFFFCSFLVVIPVGFIGLLICLVGYAASSAALLSSF
uniref:C2H2-type domain-containing protein n=1 Tax=Amphilophus citrinellus TaxID=61819 RepID=A0A3Q0QYF9_AMPCI